MDVETAHFHVEGEKIIKTRQFELTVQGQGLVAHWFGADQSTDNLAHITSLSSAPSHPEADFDHVAQVNSQWAE